MRGRLVDTLDFGEFTPAWIGAFQDVGRHSAPVLAAGRFNNGSVQCDVEMVLMPLSDGGTRIGQIFGGLIIRPLSRMAVAASDGVRTDYSSPRPIQLDFSRNRRSAG